MSDDLHSHKADPWEGWDIPDISDDGDMSWHKNGKLHREGDLPAVIPVNGSPLWYKNGIQVIK